MRGRKREHGFLYVQGLQQTGGSQLTQGCQVGMNHLLLHIKSLKIGSFLIRLLTLVWWSLGMCLFLVHHSWDVRPPRHCCTESFSPTSAAQTQRHVTVLAEPVLCSVKPGNGKWARMDALWDTASFSVITRGDCSLSVTAPGPHTSLFHDENGHFSNTVCSHM